MFRSLLRAGMTVLTQFFPKMYLLYIFTGQKSEKDSPFLPFLPPEKGLFSQIPGSSLNFSKIVESQRAIHIFGKMLYDISNRNYNSSHNTKTPQLWKRLHNFRKTSQPKKRGIFDPQRSENLATKKSLSPNPSRHVTFCNKKRGQIWYIWASGASFLIYSRL